MAKLTVYFKDKVVHSGLFESGVVHVGRDESNDIVIDSLAVAPVHAVIIIRENGSTIRQLTEDFPIALNGLRSKEFMLKNGDMITVGKHDILYKNKNSNHSDQSLNGQLADRLSEDVTALNEQISHDLKIPDANLQVMSGKSIGKLIPLKNPITRLGQNGTGAIAIEKRDEAYFVCLLTDNTASIKLNNESLNGNAVKIKHLDILTIDNTPFQFFQS
jgi:Inner membrane component of T3SS, cytoplasmic domain